MRRIMLPLSLLLSGCATLLTKIPLPIQGGQPAPWDTFPGIEFDLEGISEGYFFLLLDLPFSFVGDIFFFLLQWVTPVAWLIRPWFRNEF